MKIWTCGSSPRSGSRNAWTRIKFNSVSRLNNFRNVFGAIQMISCRDWWPWTKPGYITLTWRQSNNQWSGCIAAHHAPKKFQVWNSAGKVVALIFWDQEGILLIDYLTKNQTINAEYYSSLLVQLKDILKLKHRGKVTKGVLFLHDNASDHQTLATQKKLAYLGFHCLDHPHFSGSGPVGLPPALWTEKNNWKIAIFRQMQVIAAAETCLDGQLSEFFE